MLMINLILILLVGGVLALLSERLGETMPRKVALIVVLVDIVYLLSQLSAMPQLIELQAPMPDDPSTWLMHFKAQWIPAFGINIEFALDGISLEPVPPARGFSEFPSPTGEFSNRWYSAQ